MPKGGSAPEDPEASKLPDFLSAVLLLFIDLRPFPSVEHSPVSESLRLKSVGMKLVRLRSFNDNLKPPVAAAICGIGVDPRLGAYNPFDNREEFHFGGRTSLGLDPSQECSLLGFLVLFLIESRYSSGDALSPVPDAAAMDLKLAEAFLPLLIAKPKLVVRAAELADPRFGIGPSGGHAGGVDILGPLARISPWTVSEGRTTRKPSV